MKEMEHSCPLDLCMNSHIKLSNLKKSNEPLYHGTDVLGLSLLLYFEFIRSFQAMHIYVHVIFGMLTSCSCMSEMNKRDRAVLLLHIMIVQVFLVLAPHLMTFYEPVNSSTSC